LTKARKQKRRPLPLPPARQPVNIPTGEIPTAQTLAHGGYSLGTAAAIEREVMVTAKVIINREVLPFDSCFARGLISQQEHTAAERVYALHRQSGLASRGRDSTTLIGSIAGGFDSPVTASIHANKELARLRDHLADHSKGRYKDECYSIGMSICAHGEATGTRLPDRRRWVAFKQFLAMTARHFGIAQDA
jgi:hypothetical protein